MKFYNLSTYSIPMIWEQVFIVKYFRAVGFERWVSSGEVFNAGYAEFRRSVSQGFDRWMIFERRCSSDGDFNAGYAEFRRSVSQGFERWVLSGELFCACCPDRLCHFFKMKT